MTRTPRRFLYSIAKTWIGGAILQWLFAHFSVAVLGLLLVITILPSRYAKADVGVPPAHPGYSLSPGDLDTNVQMVSEEVEIVINADPFKASVMASFQMRNNGAEDEEIEVWFPLGELQNYAKKERVFQVADFQAWVTDEKMDITIEHSDEWKLIWAHWPVTFPAGTPVEIFVSYKLSPSWNNSPAWHGRFDYILETGAGWQGAIEEAEITIRGPYPLGELNDLLGLGDAFFAKPTGYTLNNSEIQWVFNDLEPTEEDNINFSVLEPETWHSIYDSYKALENSPDDWEAYKNMARGLWIWGSVQAGVEYQGFTDTTVDVDSIVRLAGASWMKVLELSPPDAKRYDSALSYFRRNPQVIEPYLLQNYFNEAIELFPEDEDVIDSYARALSAGIISEGAPSISPTPPTATHMASVQAATDIAVDPPSDTFSPSFSLIMGIIFIGAASVLMYAAVKRKEK